MNVIYNLHMYEGLQNIIGIPFFKYNGLNQCYRGSLEES